MNRKAPARFCDSASVLRLTRSPCGTALSTRQLQYWDQTGLLSPHARRGRGKRLYSFEDVLRLRIIVVLIEAKVPTQRIRTAIHNLRNAAERVNTPWHKLRIVTDGRSIFVLDGDRALDALRNQVVSVVLLGNLTRDTTRVFAERAARAA